MRISVAQYETHGIVYRVACQNPGCGHTFDLPITAKEAGMLAGAIACSRCGRRGGLLKRLGRVGDRVFSANLVFKPIGLGPTLAGEEGDLLSDIS